MVTSETPSFSICSKLPCNKCMTCSGSEGVPIVATAVTLSIALAAKTDAAPPKDCPIIRLGAR